MNQHNLSSLSARRCRALRWACVASAAIVMLSRAAPANAAGLTIIPNYGGSADLSALGGTTIASDPNHVNIENAINSALAVYSAKFQSPSPGFTVNITFGEMTAGLGESATYTGTVSYADYRAALVSHAQSSNDASAIASLPAAPLPTSPEPVTGGTGIIVTTADARALGFSGATPPGGFDSTILVNTALTSYTGGPGISGHYDLTSVVSHEIDEALATGSGLNDTPITPIRAEDLFRYSAPGVRSYSTSSAATSYFSIDGGVTHIVSFNQTGGGADYGDWASSGTHRVQDAFGTPGVNINLGPAEFTALDVLGYNFIQPVPEPGSLVLLGLGAVGLFLAARRRR